jgi:hypothetical protein
MSKVLQMRVNDTELAVICLGAKQRQMTMTGLIKEAVHFYLSNTPGFDLPEKDRFDSLLEVLEKGPKATVSELERKKFASIRKTVAGGKAKGLSRTDALAMLKKAK